MEVEVGARQRKRPGAVEQALQGTDYLSAMIRDG